MGSATPQSRRNQLWVHLSGPNSTPGLNINDLLPFNNFVRSKNVNYSLKRAQNHFLTKFKNQRKIQKIQQFTKSKNSKQKKSKNLKSKKKIKNLQNQKIQIKKIHKFKKKIENSKKFEKLKKN